MFSGLHTLQSSRFVMPNLVLQAVKYPPFANLGEERGTRSVIVSAKIQSPVRPLAPQDSEM